MRLKPCFAVECIGCISDLKVGKHELVAFFSGKGPNDRDYKRGASITFEKSIGAKYLELKINTGSASSSRSSRSRTGNKP